MIRADFHTHSYASPDGGITAAQYQTLLSTVLDCVAVTDHNTITAAQDLQQLLGSKIIIGEEITTREGEIIGLFLSEVVPPNLSALETVQRIKRQGGLVYIPHPFETVRKGLSMASLETIREHVDIIEVHNGRAWLQNETIQAEEWSIINKVPGAAGSDAHGIDGAGRTFTQLKALPTVGNLVKQLHQANLTYARPPIHSLLYPSYNRLRKKIQKGNKND
jgi:predicted metal-dependent phosphoesterase TrpH